MKRGAIGLGLLGLFIVISAWLLRPSPLATPVAAAEAPPPAPATDFHYQGVASCATAPCHHNNGPRGTKGAEYTTWMLEDPHTRAYRVLLDERSKTISRNLHAAEPAEKNPLCLSCHAMGVKDAEVDRRVSLLDGVGCESCHGPAEKWLRAHYQPDWAKTSADDRAKLGFRPTKDLVARAAVCVTCHVGAGDMDVNHDLIAAGHPRLNFEYGAYLANYPRHWSDSADRKDRPDLEARVWAIGQIACSKAALELLAHRASKPEKPWPEFAEYDCFACHHDLGGPAWRRSSRHTRGRPGILPWNFWYPPLGDVLTEAPPRAGLVVPVQEYARLRSLMERPLPGRTAVAQQARGLAGQLQPWLTQLDQSPYDAAKVTTLLNRLDGQRNDRLTQAGWDEAAQLYLAYAALYQARQDLGGGPAPRGFLKSFANKLAFPRSPAKGQPAREFDSPPMFDPTEQFKGLAR